MVAKAQCAMCWMCAILHISCRLYAEAPDAQHYCHPSRAMEPGQARLTRPQAYQGRAHVPDLLPPHSGQVSQVSGMSRKSGKLPANFSLPVAPHWRFCCVASCIRRHWPYCRATDLCEPQHERRKHARRVWPIPCCRPHPVCRRPYRPQPSATTCGDWMTGGCPTWLATGRLPNSTQAARGRLCQSKARASQPALHRSHP